MSIELVKGGTVGVFVRIPEDVYRMAPGVNISSLKQMMISPAHYIHRLAEEREETEALTFGTLLHSALLDPVPKEYVVRPETYPSKDGPKPWRSNAGWCQEWEERQVFPVLSEENDVRLRGCVAAVKKHWVGRMLGKAAGEVVGMMKDEETGLLMKGRADALAMDNQEKTWLFDLKTVRWGYAGEDTFGKQVGDFGYHLQAAWYLRLFGASRFVFCAIEKEPPYAIGVYELSSDDLERADRVNRLLLRRLKACADSGKFPGYSEDIMTVSVPVWKRLMEERMTE